MCVSRLAGVDLFPAYLAVTDGLWLSLQLFSLVELKVETLSVSAPFVNTNQLTSAGSLLISLRGSIET